MPVTRANCDRTTFLFAVGAIVGTRSTLDIADVVRCDLR